MSHKRPLQARLDAVLASRLTPVALVAGLALIVILNVVVWGRVLEQTGGRIPGLDRAEPQPVLSLPTSEFTPIPPPDPAAVEAEIGLLEVAPSEDGAALLVTVSIYNYNTTPLTITENDARLNLPAGGTLAPLAASPELPFEFDPGQTQKFTFTFPMPETPGALLQVFTVEWDLEY